MEGLIKGLIDVALGGNNNDRDRDRDDNQPRDERSRSSWAEVVSGDQQDKVHLQFPFSSLLFIHGSIHLCNFSINYHHHVYFFAGAERGVAIRRF